MQEATSENHLTAIQAEGVTEIGSDGKAAKITTEQVVNADGIEVTADVSGATDAAEPAQDSAEAPGQTLSVADADYAIELAEELGLRLNGVLGDAQTALVDNFAEKNRLHATWLANNPATDPALKPLLQAALYRLDQLPAEPTVDSTQVPLVMDDQTALGAPPDAQGADAPAQAPAPEAAPADETSGDAADDALLQSAREWIAGPVTERKRPSMKMFRDLAGARDQSWGAYIALQTQLNAAVYPAGSPEYTKLTKDHADAVVRWSRLHVQLEQLSQEFDNWMTNSMKDAGAGDALTATTQEGADDALLTQFHGEEKAKQKTRLEAFKEKLSGASSATLKKIWDLNTGASTSALLNFLLTGADRGFGASEWKSHNEKSAEEKNKLVEPTIFKELLQNKPRDLAVLLLKSYGGEGGGDSLQKIGWQITSEDKKKLETLGATSPAPTLETVSAQLPDLLTQLVRFFSDDPDSGKRWEAARPVFAAALPDGKGRDKMLAQQSGLDLYACVKDSWWKHWPKQ